jgi:O-antigen ligase
VKTRILEPYEGKENNAGTNFIKSNFGGALESFNDNPFTASGIGGFMGRYGRYEVHSTYLKIIGETGIVGIIGYLVFMFYFLRIFFVSTRISKQNPYASFIRELSPLIIGCIISWGYTYHLRKREFWIMYAIVYIAFRLMKRTSAITKNNTTTT